jgi:toxin ParE1/3/4
MPSGKELGVVLQKILTQRNILNLYKPKREMASYIITKKAVDDVTMIWDYIYEVWSENQADKYYLEILEDCQVLAENQNFGRKYEEISIEIFGYKSGQHLIIFRKLNERKIEMIRILHSIMDLSNRIEE